MTGPWFPDPATSRAVLIGASRFTATDLPDIPAVLGNLTGLRAALTDPANGTLTAPHCTVLTDPTSPAVVGAALATASEQATDLLLVYYAGHGILDDDGLLHFALGETLTQRAGYTAVPLELLKRDLGRARARARVLVLDCCFSGQAVEAMGASDGLATGQLRVTGTYTLTSTTATTPAHAPRDAEHTAFTGALLRAMASPRPLTLDDLYTHVDNDLAARGLPRPQCRASNTAGRIGLVRGPVPVQSAPPPQPELVYDLALTSTQSFFSVGAPVLMIIIAALFAANASSINANGTMPIALPFVVVLAVLTFIGSHSSRFRKVVITHEVVTGHKHKESLAFPWSRVRKVELRTVLLNSGGTGTTLCLVVTEVKQPNRIVRWQIPGIAMPAQAVARAVREYAPPGTDIVVAPKKTPTGPT
ncbi:MAG TPA: caspase family protein [Pseudonocardiaceae bacterium]|jgi:hypothetical protein|nr:caspase family protein [Pseudonocardiaceae bacterium]